MSRHESTATSTTTTTDGNEMVTLPDLCRSEELFWLAPAERHARVVEAIRDDVSALLLIHDPSTIDVERPLHQYGFDDIGGEMLGESLEVMLDINLARTPEFHQLSIQVCASWALSKWFHAHWRAPDSPLH